MWPDTVVATPRNHQPKLYVCSEVSRPCHAVQQPLNSHRLRLWHHRTITRRRDANTRAWKSSDSCCSWRAWWHGDEDIEHLCDISALSERTQSHTYMHSPTLRNKSKLVFYSTKTRCLPECWCYCWPRHWRTHTSHHQHTHTSRAMDRRLNRNKPIYILGTTTRTTRHIDRICASI